MKALRESTATSRRRAWLNFNSTKWLSALSVFMNRRLHRLPGTARIRSSGPYLNVRCREVFWASGSRRYADWPVTTSANLLSSIVTSKAAVPRVKISFTRDSTTSSLTSGPTIAC
eukprot:TRINITY_DN11549_c0_g1::TRINITY_DN11549_c0_g1_i1::g.21989::m.21989 TRINITY_DN11549_c0_g1::TRINITY_DN11549_c0_g1_i1::g.21989  ORF type:complete len:115 (-),score=-6.09,DUF3175/PF11373.3/0.076 TRINITY_DN11549_c0_g1_i1:908-1252(-)